MKDSKGQDRRSNGRQGVTRVAPLHRRTAAPQVVWEAQGARPGNCTLHGQPSTRAPWPRLPAPATPQPAVGDGTNPCPRSRCRPARRVRRLATGSGTLVQASRATHNRKGRRTAMLGSTATAPVPTLPCRVPRKGLGSRPGPASVPGAYFMTILRPNVLATTFLAGDAGAASSY